MLVLSHSFYRLLVAFSSHFLLVHFDENKKKKKPSSLELLNNWLSFYWICRLKRKMFIEYAGKSKILMLTRESDQRKNSTILLAYLKIFSVCRLCVEIHLLYPQSMFQRQITIEMNVNVINASLDVCCCVRLFARPPACFVLFGVFFVEHHPRKAEPNCIEYNSIHRANNCKLPFRFVNCVINIRLSHGRKCFKTNSFWNATISNWVFAGVCSCADVAFIYRGK